MTDERKKANAIFWENHRQSFMPGKAVSFSEAFPDVVEMRVQVFDGRSSWGPRTYTLNDPPGEYHDCTESLCYNGGVNVGMFLREMVRERKTSGLFHKPCKGYWGSPRGKVRYNECKVFFKVEIELKFREDGSAGSGEVALQEER